MSNKTPTRTEAQSVNQDSDAVSNVSIEDQDGLNVILSARDDLTETEKDIIRLGVEMSESTYADVRRECERRGMDVSYNDVWQLLSEEVPRDAYNSSNDSEESDEDAQDEFDEIDLEDVPEDEEVYTRSRIEHDLLKPLVFARSSATGEREKILSEAEELVKIMLKKDGNGSL